MKRGGIILKNNLFKFAVIFYVVLFAIPSYGSVADPDPIGTGTRSGSTYRAERATYGIAGITADKLSDQDVKADEQKKIIEKLRNDLRVAAVKEATGFVKLINEQGAEAAIVTIEKFIQQKGYTSKKGTVNGISYISYAFKPNTSPNAPDFVYQYSVHPAQNQCQVVAAIPALKIQEAAAANYIKPMPKLTLTESVSKYLGLTLKDKQDKANGHNGFKVLNLDPKGFAGKAGIKAGDLIIKIDAFDITKDHNVDRISAYIDGRIQKKALMKIVLLRNSARKSVEIQF